MSETGKPRLVGCPKCGSLLPEHTGSPFYQCAACGAVLSVDRGNASMDRDPLFENSDEEVVQRFSERVYDNIGHDADDDVRSNASSSSRAGRRRFVNSTFDNPRPNTRIDDYAHGRMDRGFDEPRSRMGNMNGMQRFGKNWDRRFADINENYEMDGFSRPSRNDAVGSSYSLDYQHRGGNNGYGPSRNDAVGSSYSLDYQHRGGNNGYGEVNPLSRRNDMDEKAELLRRLEELKVQVIRSGDVVDKAKDKRRFSPDPYAYQEEVSPDGYSKRPVQYAIPDQYDSRPSHASHYNEPAPYMNRHGFQSLPRGPFRDPPYDSFTPNINHHHPSCSCFQCHNQYRAQGVPKEPPFHHPQGYQNHGPGLQNRGSGSQSYGPGSQNRGSMYDRDRAASFQSSNQPSHQRFPSDVTSEASGFSRSSLPARILATRGTRMCQPIAGGAPFLACNGCHKLLKLPKKMILVVNGNPKQMRCGSCSIIIEVTIDSKTLYTTVESDANGANSKAGVSFRSDEFDDSGNNFQPNSLEAQGKGIEPPPPKGASLQDHFDYSTNYRRPKQDENGNRSKRYEMDKPIQDGSATEMEISSKEYGNNTGTTLGSGEPSKEGEELRARETADAFFAKMMDARAADDYDEEEEEERPSVTINGNLISDRLVKKAEKLAGPIRPGHYWYDFRAGFWGVIGGPCLGIIPPFIEEFNFPMPENCAGGSTGVYVNGRELHPKDLRLLSSRGLPSDRGRSLILEISGRVLDANTGEELESLGKLAPTIERYKRGFGMKYPNESA